MMEEYGFAGVLSVETMVNDLRKWKPEMWVERIGLLKKWSNELFYSIV